MVNSKFKTKTKSILTIQSLVFLYSIVSVLSKFTSGIMEKHGILSYQFILLFGGMVACLGVYAILWQQILKTTELIAAYVHKSTTLIWSLFWSATIFHETISWNNVLGIIIAVIGIVLVTKDD